MNEWIVPGTATSAVIFTVIIFLRQMRYMQTKYDKSIAASDERNERIAKAFQEQITRMDVTRDANEERRMAQIQGIFDKFLLIATQMVQGMTELKSGFASLAQRLEAGLREQEVKRIEHRKDQETKGQ